MLAQLFAFSDCAPRGCSKLKGVVMSAKRFFYVAGGIFLLAGAYQLGARDALATYVDHSGATGPVIAATDNATLLRSDGQALYYRAATHSWVRIDYQAPLPVPISEVAFWGEVWFVTRSGVLWQMDSNLPGPPYPWVSRGQMPLPERPVGTVQKGWSDVKGTYRK